MDRARHTPAGDRSFVVSLIGHVAAAVALVAVVAAAFWGVGQVRDPDTGPAIVAAPDDDGGDPGSPGQVEPTGPDEDAAPQPDEDPAPEEPVEPVQPTDPTQEPTPDPEPDPQPTEDTSEGAVEPSEVSVQMLDATGDGGRRMEAAVQQLREDGWRVVATNQASRYYERSTIFYTPGHEDAARALADRYPHFQVVQEKPDNLSSSVAVHVVIGGDYPEPSSD